MRIAQVAPLAESVPPALYGGTERVVSVLTEALVERGHDVTLFASADSKSSARLVGCSTQGLRLDPAIKYPIPPTLIELSQVYASASEFDIIHNHVDYLAFPFARASATPTVTTTHGRLDQQKAQEIYKQFPEQKLISISHDQASHLPNGQWIANVYNAVDLTHFRFQKTGGGYLAFLGRISPEKGADQAIEIARRSGMRLIIAAKIESLDQDHYDHVFKPLVDTSPFVGFVGEVDEGGKDELLGGAHALLFPIDWPEPFGLAMIESMATGTPVIAYRHGSVPEVVIDGVTGFICDSLAEMVDAVDRVPNLDRARSRLHVETHFSPKIMVSGYESVYESVVSSYGAGRWKSFDDGMPSRSLRYT
jgi:glycosyltransferase involved in cell wall biosynthesis